MVADFLVQNFKQDGWATFLYVLQNNGYLSIPGAQDRVNPLACAKHRNQVGLRDQWLLRSYAMHCSNNRNAGSYSEFTERPNLGKIYQPSITPYLFELYSPNFSGGGLTSPAQSQWRQTGWDALDFQLPTRLSRAPERNSAVLRRPFRRDRDRKQGAVPHEVVSLRGSYEETDFTGDAVRHLRYGAPGGGA